MSLSDEGNFFSNHWMEESYAFDLEQTTPEIVEIVNQNTTATTIPTTNTTTTPNIDTQHLNFKILGAVSCASAVETKGAFKDCDLDSDEMFGSPFNGDHDGEGESEGDVDFPLNWENELSRAIGGGVEPSDREVPVMPIDDDTKDELVNMPVKDFNTKTKALKLDHKVLEHLKLCRKRLKNRQAAIRSRSKKENETLYLQRRVDDLTRERDQQTALITQLQQKLAAMEKKLKS